MGDVTCSWEEPSGGLDQPHDSRGSCVNSEAPLLKCQSLGRSDTHLWALLTPSANYFHHGPATAFGRALAWRSGGPGPHPATPTGVGGWGVHHQAILSPFLSLTGGKKDDCPFLACFKELLRIK